MLSWLKKHSALIVSVLVTIGFFVFAYSCESKVESLNCGGVQVSRQELQLELDQFISLAQFRMADLDRQDQFKTLLLQNAMILVQGQPFNPAGMLTGLAAIYGIAQAGSNVGKTVNNIRKKRKVNNGTA